MDIIESEEYEGLGAEFQYEVIDLLNQTLKKYNISKNTRKEICADFLFDFSMLLDQGEIKNTIPTMAFKQSEKLFLKNKWFQYHEYAFGNLDLLFDSEQG